MKYIVTAEEMKRADAYTMNTIGIPSLVLMERAAWLLEKEQEKTAGGPSQKMTEPSEHNKLTLKLPSANAE